MMNMEGAEFYEPMSYKNFMKSMEHIHPMDPLMKTKFDINSRITVKDYWVKLSDICFCYEIYLRYK